MDVDSYLNQLQEADERAHQFRSRVKDCSLIEFRIMDMLARRPNMCLNEIGAERWVYQQGVGRLTKRLSARGLVQVAKDDRDGRAKRVTLTEQGMQLRAACREVLKGIQ